MWQPLAFADIATVLMGIWRDLRGDRDMKIPSHAEWLRRWALPFMAEAVDRDGKDAAARAEFEAFKSLKKRLDKRRGGSDAGGNADGENDVKNGGQPCEVKDDAQEN